MNVLFNPDNGKTFLAILDGEWPNFLYKIEKGRYWIIHRDGSLNGDKQPGYLVLNIAEDEPEIGLPDAENALRTERKLIRHHLYYNPHAEDKDRNQRYSVIDNAGEWELHEKEGWVQNPRL